MKAKLINEHLPFEMVEFDFNPETLKYTAVARTPPRRCIARRRRLDAVDPVEGSAEVAARHRLPGRRRRARSRRSSSTPGWIRAAVCSGN